MSADYLQHLAWALPILGGQAALGHRRIWRARRRILLAVGGATAWLSATDGIAIRAGIWRFGSAHLCGLRLGPVPIEEVLFFLLTSLLVAFGLLLFEKD